MTQDILTNLAFAERIAQKEEARQEEARLDTLGSLALSRDLANDTIRIALGIVGIDPNSMTQFERASALLDMATEYKAMSVWKRLYARTWEQTMRE